MHQGPPRVRRAFFWQVRPLEEMYKFGSFFSPLLTESDFEAKPSVMLLGQYSTGALAAAVCLCVCKCVAVTQRSQSEMPHLIVSLWRAIRTRRVGSVSCQCSQGRARLPRVAFTEAVLRAPNWFLSRAGSAVRRVPPSSLQALALWHSTLLSLKHVAEMPASSARRPLFTVCNHSCIIRCLRKCSLDVRVVRRPRCMLLWCTREEHVCEVPAGPRLPWHQHRPGADHRQVCRC
jgi:N-terminal EH-domain containing protein